eukprot:sb/3468771/
MGKRKLKVTTGDVIPLESTDTVTEQTLDKTYKGMGVLYVGHIPKSFQEKEMRQFFEQFGTILKLRISRSKKTSESKGYAFILFENEEVARIVAKTMHDYILCGRLLKSAAALGLVVLVALSCHTVFCQFIPMDKVHKDTFKGSNRTFKKIDWQAKNKVVRNKVKTVEEQQSAVKRLLKAEKNRRRKITALGIDYQFPGYFSIEISSFRTPIDCISLFPAPLKPYSTVYMSIHSLFASTPTANIWRDFFH